MAIIWKNLLLILWNRPILPLRTGNDQTKHHYGNVAFYVLLEEASAAKPTFTIKHKNVLNADWHANNKLGATGLTNVTCTGCSLSGTTFTPSGDLANEGESLKITVTYTDTLTASTPAKTYTVTCEEAPYKITYDSNGGSAVAAQEYEKTTNITLAVAPTNLVIRSPVGKCLPPKAIGRSYSIYGFSKCRDGQVWLCYVTSTVDC